MLCKLLVFRHFFVVLCDLRFGLFFIFGFPLNFWPARGHAAFNEALRKQYTEASLIRISAFLKRGNAVQLF